MKLAILVIFLFFLSVITGVLTEIGILPSTGLWDIQYKGETLQGILVASTALLVLDVIFILNIRSKIDKKTSTFEFERGLILATKLLSWSFIASIVCIISVFLWFSYENWINMIVTMYMFMFQLLMTLIACIEAKILSF